MDIRFNVYFVITIDISVYTYFNIHLMSLAEYLSQLNEISMPIFYPADFFQIYAVSLCFTPVRIPLLVSLYCIATTEHFPLVLFIQDTIHRIYNIHTFIIKKHVIILIVKKK